MTWFCSPKAHIRSSRLVTFHVHVRRRLQRIARPRDPDCRQDLKGVARLHVDGFEAVAGLQPRGNGERLADAHDAVGGRAGVVRIGETITAPASFELLVRAEPGVRRIDSRHGAEHQRMRKGADHVPGRLSVTKILRPVLGPFDSEAELAAGRCARDAHGVVNPQGCGTGVRIVPDRAPRRLSAPSSGEGPYACGSGLSL